MPSKGRSGCSHTGSAIDPFCHAWVTKGSSTLSARCTRWHETDFEGLVSGPLCQALITKVQFDSLTLSARQIIANEEKRAENCHRYFSLLTEKVPCT